jgi:hypothetical protein
MGECSAQECALAIGVVNALVQKCLPVKLLKLLMKRTREITLLVVECMLDIQNEAWVPLLGTLCLGSGVGRQLELRSAGTLINELLLLHACMQVAIQPRKCVKN